jgi:hypothetical protein
LNDLLAITVISAGGVIDILFFSLSTIVQQMLVSTASYQSEKITSWFNFLALDKAVFTPETYTLPRTDLKRLVL